MILQKNLLWHGKKLINFKKKMKKLLGILVLGLLWCNVAVALSESTKNNIINTIENNAMVSKAKFGHDEVGGDSSYTIFWIWMPEISGKDYNAIADYFCPVFKVNGLSGITVSIKKSGTYNTLGRAYCR